MKKIYFLLLVLFLFNTANSQIINFPDANFKAKLLAADVTNYIAQDFSGNYVRVDTNYDNEVDINEASIIRKLDVSNSNITDLTGIMYFSNLDALSCENNQMLSLNVTTLVNLETLDCGFNHLINLNVSGLSHLRYLNCTFNLLNGLDLTGLSLFNLNCSNNGLFSLNVGNMSFLNNLNCSVNNLTTLNVSNCSDLIYLHCQNNQITTLNLNQNTHLFSLYCDNNQLTQLFLKNNSSEANVYFQNNPNLIYICVDEAQLSDIQNKVSNYGYTNCAVSSYCSFTPGGTYYYTIQGNNKFDLNTNGCDATDPTYPNLKFTIANGTTTQTIISNTTGNYSIPLPLQAGTYTVTPVLENPSYFSVTPGSFSVSFPTQASPFTQNFCVKPIGVHPDLEVSILPTSIARPGFDAKYKMIYKNKGNNTQSGFVNITFNDAVLDFVSAYPAVSTQAINSLSWNFTNLLPFETREITFTLNVNSPMETPAVNNGDILNYTATIVSPTTDDMPNDNTFVFNQTVVNSYDPNDKACLEGATIPPTKVGDYVHYMIRFENNGTANAHNIVVKDMIDTNKFDVNSLVVLKGSHNYYTRINGNKVEFIFENINLPFDDANNDGYVSFKIKTKPTLTNGDTFSNSASIYFDYNFPIVTNTATTTIQALATQDFDFGTYFSLYPNPAQNILNMKHNSDIEVNSISIYNTLGQLLLVIPNAENTKDIDLSSLAKGNYFIKINSNKGVSNTKFIKQ